MQYVVPQMTNFTVYILQLQAAKEFELEMKKDPGALAEPPVEEVKAVSQEEKQHATVTSTRETS